MILTWLGIGGLWLAAWVGLGVPLDLAWWPSLIVPGAWAVGIARRRRGWLAVGFLLSVGLAIGVGFGGQPIASLVVTALALWTWDLSHLWVYYPQRGDRQATRLARAARLRSSVLCAAGLLGGVGVSSLSVSLPFLGLVGGAIALWLGLVLLVRGVGRAYRAGGEASGNRSSSSELTL